MVRRLLVPLVALGFLFTLGLAVSAQAPGGAAQPQMTMTNLQVWPKDTSPAVVLQFMNAFNDSLGVQCNYCHVEQGGRLNFASDDKREKRVARDMIMLRDAINVMMGAIVSKPAGAGPTAVAGQPGAPVRVLCSSCHRGLPVPRSLADVVTETATANGWPAGLAKYRALRDEFYGGQQYDFRENALIGIAQRASDAKHPEDAIGFLQENLKYFPKSSRTYQALGQARNTSGDKAGAIKDLEKAVELDANNAQAKTQLQQLAGR